MQHLYLDRCTDLTGKAKSQMASEGHTLPYTFFEYTRSVPHPLTPFPSLLFFISAGTLPASESQRTEVKNYYDS